jgi:hypothetical protein
MRAHEVPAGAARDHGELDLLRLTDAVHDLVDGAVAADRDEQRGAVRDRAACELRQLARPLGEQCLAAQAALGCEVGDLGPAAPGRAVLGSRVDEEDRANGAQR